MDHAIANDILELEHDITAVLGILRRSEREASAFAFWKRCADEVIEKRRKIQLACMLHEGGSGTPYSARSIKA